MPPGHLNLLFDQVKVVEQPLGGVGDPPGLVGGVGRAIVVSKNLLVLVQPGQQAVGASPGDDLVMRRESFGMARQLFEAEQLRPQRRLARGGKRMRLLRHPVSPVPRHRLHGILRFQSLESSKQRVHCDQAKFQFLSDPALSPLDRGF